MIVTAFSSNHFKESLDFFGSVHKELPQVKMIVYDLGLTASQMQSIKGYCNVQEVRKFKFEKYPSHTKDLFKYAWKPFIIKEISEEFELFLYCDASCRIKRAFREFLLNVTKFPLVPNCMLGKGSAVLRSTHDGMLKYFNASRDELLEVVPQGGFPGGIQLIWVSKMWKEKILTPWVDCAMHLECISPAGAKLSGCNFGTKPSSAYVGCHRYDQSALNVIMGKEFEASLLTIFRMPKCDGIGIF